MSGCHSKLPIPMPCPIMVSKARAYYELKERAGTLAHKLSTVQDTASALTDLIDAQRSLRLEITVVALIAVEIAITFYDLFFRRF